MQTELSHRDQAELIAQQNRLLGAIQDSMVAGGYAFVRENGLDEKAFMIRLQTAAEEPVVKAKAPARTRVQTKPAIEHTLKPKPVVQEQVRDGPVREHRIKPKDDAWDDGH